jgi:hypothetical protein
LTEPDPEASPTTEATSPHPPMCPCVACLAESAIVLVRRGRPDMALRLLEELPGLIRAGLSAAYAKGQEDGLEAARKAGHRPAKRAAQPTKPRPAFAEVAAELAGHVEALGGDRVAAVLGVAVDDLGPMLESRAAAPASALRRLRETTE